MIPVHEDVNHTIGVGFRLDCESESTENDMEQPPLPVCFGESWEFPLTLDCGYRFIISSIPHNKTTHDFPIENWRLKRFWIEFE